MINKNTNERKRNAVHRPLPVRLIALVMALVMVLSVVYINNRNDRVKAEPVFKQDDNYIPSKITNTTTEYTVNVPIIKNGAVSGIMFKLPDLEQGEPISDEASISYYKIVKTSGSTQNTYYSNNSGTSATGIIYNSVAYFNEGGLSQIWVDGSMRDEHWVVYYEETPYSLNGMTQIQFETDGPVYDVDTSNQRIVNTEDESDVLPIVKRVKVGEDFVEYEEISAIEVDGKKCAVGYTTKYSNGDSYTVTASKDYSITRYKTIINNWGGDAVPATGGYFIVTGSEEETFTAKKLESASYKYLLSGPDISTPVEINETDLVSDYNAGSLIPEAVEPIEVLRINVKTYVPAEISIDTTTQPATFIDADSSGETAIISDTDTESYYGSISYNVTVDPGDTMRDYEITDKNMTFTEINNRLAKGIEGNGQYTITKNIYATIGDEKVLIYSSKDVDKKDVYVYALKNIEVYNGDELVGSWTASQSSVSISELDLTDKLLDPSKETKIYYEPYQSMLSSDNHNAEYVGSETDVFGGSIGAASAEGNGYSHKISGNINYNDKSAEYKISCQALGAYGGKTFTFNVKLKFDNGTPTATITNSQQKNAKNKSFELTSSYTVPAGSSAIITSSKVYQGEDESNLIAVGDMKVSGLTGSYVAELKPGKNVFKIDATSGYGITSEKSEAYSIFYDDTDPEIYDVKLIQDGTNKTGSKITCKRDAKITFKVKDDGASSELKKAVITLNGNEVSSTFADGEYTIDLPASNSNNNKTFVYKLNLSDNSGRTATEKECKVQFQNDDTTIKFEVKPQIDQSTYFVVWGADPNVAKVLVNVTTSNDVNIKKVEAAIDLNDKNGEFKDISDTGTVGASAGTFTVDLKQSVSKTIKKIRIRVTKNNGVVETAEYGVIHIDVFKPTLALSVEGNTGKWFTSDFMLVATITDPTNDGDSDAVSGLKTAYYTVTNSKKNTSKTAIPINGGTATTRLIGVYESSNTDGTKVSFEASDKANNIYTDSFVYLVDTTAPSAGLSIGGVAPENVASHLNKDPDIYFTASDSLSGLDTYDILINGKSYKNVIDKGIENKKKLSEIVGETSDTTEFTVVVTAKDVAGNETTITSNTFKVDINKPIIDKSEITSSSIKDNGYYNTDVTVHFEAEDSNISTTGLTVTDGAGNSIAPEWEETDKGFKSDYTFKAEGAYNITFKAKDKSGNESTKTFTFTIDKSVPVVTTYKNDEVYTGKGDYHNEEVSATIAVEDANPDSQDVTTTITRNIFGDGSTTDEEKGIQTFNFYDDGYYELNFKVVDKAGNETTKSIGFTVDTVSPVHNIYILTDNPEKTSSYHNNYVNVVNTFNTYQGQESYEYGQVYKGSVDLELNCFDYNIDSIHVSDNGTEFTPEWTYGENGYSWANTTISAEGYHDIKIWSTDLAGNETEDADLGKRVRFTIDTTAPAITTYLNGAIYNEGSGTRYLNTTGSVNVIVNDTNKDDSDLTRTVIMSPPGGGSTTTEGKISEGTEDFSTEADYEVRYSVVDKAGNVSATRTVYFRVDRTAPELSISDVGAASTANSVTISFGIREDFYQDMTSAELKIYKKNDGTGESLLKTVSLSPTSANFTHTETFSDDAEYRFEFTAEDKCGNKASKEYSFIKDGTAPLIFLSGVSNYDKTDGEVELIVTVNEAFYSSNKVTLTGTRTDIDGNKTDIQFDNVVTNVSKISEISKLFKEDGIYDITITSKDKAGNESSKSVHFTIDTTDPEIGDISKYDGIRTNKFKWDLDLNDLVTDLTVCEINMYLDGSLYDGVSDIEDGSHVLRIEATDELGHTSFKEVTFVIDSIGPNIIVSNIENDERIEEARNITVSVQLDEDILDEVTLNGKAISVANNQAAFDVTESGDYKLEAKAHDLAGNESSVSMNFSFGKPINYLLIGIIAGVAILLLLLLLLLVRRRNNDKK